MPDFKVTRYRIRIDEHRRGPDTPFSAVFLSDLHNASYGEGNSRLLQEIRNEAPEAVFVAGDMVISTAKPQMDVAIALMYELTKKYPVYHVNGNHELRLQERKEDAGEAYEEYISSIQSFGVHVLENSSERIEIHRMPITLWGLSLPLEYYRRLRAPELAGRQIEDSLGRPDASGYQLLLTHHPLYFASYAAWGADLTLAGHLHGGIVRLPLLGGVFSPQFRLFPKYDKGLYTLGGKKMVVSAGLGSHTVNLRINNPPELVVLDFR